MRGMDSWSCPLTSRVSPKASGFLCTSIASTPSAKHSPWPAAGGELLTHGGLCLPQLSLHSTGKAINLKCGFDSVSPILRIKSTDFPGPSEVADPPTLQAPAHPSALSELQHPFSGRLSLTHPPTSTPEQIL